MRDCYRGSCPYCNAVFTGDGYEEVKEKLRKHMLTDHYEQMLGE